VRVDSDTGTDGVPDGGADVRTDGAPDGGADVCANWSMRAWPVLCPRLVWWQDLFALPRRCLQYAV
jgi:hypothetical protein